MKRNVIEFRVDENTGEVLKATPGVFTPQEDLEKRWEFYKIREKFKRQGSFVWFLYKRAEELSLPVAPATLTRLAFLSTFMNYDNKLVKDEPDDPLNIEEGINKQQLQKIMCLPKDTFYRFYKEVIDVGVLIEKDGEYYLSDKYFKKGTLGRKDKKGRTRFYLWGIRNLYVKSELKDHKMLGYGFMIMPYVNIEWNVICWNPEEKNHKRVQPMTISEIMEILGLNISNFAKFRKALLSVVVNKYQLLHLVDEEKLFVSPHVYYAGTDKDKVAVLGIFDKIVE